MKKITISFFALLLIVAFKASAQKEQMRQVSGFTSISNNGSFDVHVKIDGTESVRVVAPADEYDKIETVVEGGRLRIGTKRGLNWRDGIRGNVDVYVTAKSLSALENSGSGEITLTGDLHGGEVKAYNSGSGAVKVTGNVSGESIYVINSGSGDVKIDGVASADKIDIGSSGSGNIITGIKTGDLNAHLSGSGSMTFTGTADNARIAISSSGQINGRRLHAGTVEASVVGSGNIHIGVDKSIKARITGSGDIVYNGSGSLTEVRTTGSGGIHKGNDE